MSLLKKNIQRKHRRAERVRNRLKVSDLPRISVFRSLNHMYAQLIDDAKGHTVASCSTTELKVKGDKKAQAHAVGLELAKRVQEKGIDQAKFDRGQFLYHGRVKAVVEGLRQGGLKI